MKRVFYLLTISVISVAAGRASPIFSLGPLDGALSGSAGSVVGWGFTITDTTDFLVVSETDFCVSATQASDLPCASQVQSLGTYTDFSASDFVVVGPAPYSTTVTQDFDPGGPAGFGSFAINGNAVAGTVLSGGIAVIYDLFDGDPANGGAQIGGDNFIALPASVTVVPSVQTPEPGTMAPLGLAAVGLMLLRRRLRYCKWI
jgi:hypothetical protein